jgi:thioredoxin 1
MSDKNVVHVSDESFDRDVLQADTPVLVDFWAEWCGPCKAIGPVLDEAASQYAGRLKIAKVNVDENGSTPAKFHIRGIPTLLLFKKGQLVGQKVGALPKAALTAFIEQALTEREPV